MAWGGGLPIALMEEWGGGSALDATKPRLYDGGGGADPSPY